MATDEEEKNLSQVENPLEVLVWPKVIERRARRKKLEEKGWVLGWKLPSKHDNSNSSRPQDKSRSIWLCAGILNTSQSFAEYEKRLKLIQENAALLSPSEPSLVESLEILATWRRASIKAAPSKSAKGAKSNTSNEIEENADLPVITNEKNYPWIQIDADEHDGNSVESNATAPKDNKTTKDRKQKRKRTLQTASSQQLLYYSVYPDNPLAHLSTEFQASNFYMLLDRINHSQEILQMVQTGNISKETIIEKANSGDEKKKDTMKRRGRKESNDDDVRRIAEEKDTKPDVSVGNILQQVFGFLFSQSLVLQHFHQMTSQSQSILGTMPVLQCWQRRREISSFFSRPSSSKKNFHNYPTSLTPWKSQLVQTQVAQCNQWVTSLLDMILGLLACLILLVIHHYSPSPAGLFHISVKESLFQFLQSGVDWLETFPAGFKLNVKITSNLGYEIRNLLHWHQELLQATIWNLEFNRDWLFPLLGGIGFCFGWTGLFAVLVDLTRLEVLHTLVLAKIFRNLYQAELYLLSSLWRLFRGKKSNRLRKRTDSMQYDSTQLLVGTIGFCICIFLWTTILVYYTFFMLWNLALQLPIMVLWVLYMVARALPLASLWLRSTKVNWFTENVCTQVLLEEDDNFTIARLVGMNQSPGKILQNSLQPHLKSLAKWLVDSILELLKARSSNQAPCAFPVATLLEIYNQNANEKI